MGNSKKYVVETDFIEICCKLNLNLNEFLLLLYFVNADDLTFDLEKISLKLKVDPKNILDAFNSLMNKNIINVVSAKNDLGKRIDKISLEGLAKGIEEHKINENKKKLKEDIFSIFQKEFKRPLTGQEFEIIKAWEEIYNEEIVLLALNEAVYNGAINTRYIDTILYEWKKKGLKTKEDVEEYFKTASENKKLEETSVFDYDWLSDYDK